ncbi:importin subunit beta-like [Drosophila obscura]|uniref:importin subunit beta-like n=1 Tax=Drosophila obscura TaxID=7282 RepID=UPI001BB25737|nr:importin subunit beta-like [Drosophila obscura]
MDLCQSWQSNKLEMELVAALQNTVCQDPKLLLAVRQFMEEAAASNMAEFLKAMSVILANKTYSAVARSAAGLQIKSSLTSNDESVRKQKQETWHQFPNESRELIKHNLLATLGTENTRPSCAAQCVAVLAVIELPLQRWEILIQTLRNNVVGEGSSELLRESALEAIGYICQDIQCDLTENQLNQMLSAIVHGMRWVEPSQYVRLAATTALYNSLELTEAIFEKEVERNAIMQVVCEATVSKDKNTCVAALQCLVKIVSLYYQLMEPYMTPALCSITLEAVKAEHDDIALQGIEFWSTVCQEEIELEIERQEATEDGRAPTCVSMHYARGALHSLVPVLIDRLSKQDECEDEDVSSPAKASSICLRWLTSTSANEMLALVLPFLLANITSDDWRLRNAVLITFGSVLSELDANTLKPLADQLMPAFIQLMSDSSANVRSSAARNLAQVFKIVPEAAIDQSYLEPLVQLLLKGLQAEPRVASNVCLALIGLSNAASKAAPTGETYALSPFFEFIMAGLLATSERFDGGQANLRGTAYDALQKMIGDSSLDCYLVVQRTTIVIFERISQAIQMERHISEQRRRQLNETLSLLCATLQSLLRKIHKEECPQISDAVMNAMLSIIQLNAGKSGRVQESGFLVVSALVDRLGVQFAAYMPAFKHLLICGLQTHQKYLIFCASIGLFVNICHALKEQLVPYCDEIMSVLMTNLMDPSVHRNVKPPILSAFGDLARAIGSHFLKYFDMVLGILLAASNLQKDPTNIDTNEYIVELRENVVLGYFGILQSLMGLDQTGHPLMHLAPHLPHIIGLINRIAQDGEISDSSMPSAANLIGDLCTCFGPQLRPLMDTAAIIQLLDDGKQSMDNDIFTRVIEIVQKITGQSSTQSL